MALIKCPECGAKIPEDTKRCPRCGTPISVNTESAKYEDSLNNQQFAEVEIKNVNILWPGLKWLAVSYWLVCFFRNLPWCIDNVFDIFDIYNEIIGDIIWDIIGAGNILMYILLLLGISICIGTTAFFNKQIKSIYGIMGKYPQLVLLSIVTFFIPEFLYLIHELISISIIFPMLISVISIALCIIILINKKYSNIKMPIIFICVYFIIRISHEMIFLFNDGVISVDYENNAYNMLIIVETLEFLFNIIMAICWFRLLKNLEISVCEKVMHKLNK